MKSNIQTFDTKEEARDAFLRDVSNHRELIKKAFDKYGEVFCKVAGADYSTVEARITAHDLSKLSNKIETIGIMAYFYRFPTEDLPIDSPRRKYMYQRSLLAHYHENSYYLEHWIDMSNGQFIALEMDPESIVEMVLDWIAVGENSKYMPADKYWACRKDKKLINDKTKEIVDKLIDLYTLSKVKEKQQAST